MHCETSEVATQWQVADAVIFSTANCVVLSLPEIRPGVAVARFGPRVPALVVMFEATATADVSSVSA